MTNHVKSPAMNNVGGYKPNGWLLSPNNAVTRKSEKSEFLKALESKQRGELPSNVTKLSHRQPSAS